MQKINGALLLTLFALAGCSVASFKSQTMEDDSSRDSGDAQAAEGPGKAADGSEGTIDSTDVEVPAKPAGEKASLPPPKSEDVNALKLLCKTNADKVQKVSRTLKYPKRENCSFGKAPNLKRRQGHLQAREISPATLELPAGAICDISIASDKDAMLHYDDFLVLTLAQQVVFATNKLLMDSMQQQQNIYIWDFDRVVGKKIKDFGADRYCVGKDENCRLPAHDKSGTVAIKLTSEEIAPLAITLDGKSQVPMDLIAMGDNNDKDCFHSDLELKVDIHFIEKK